MNPIIKLAGSALTTTVLLSACGATPTQPETTLALLPPPEQVCSAQLSQPAPELKLPGTDAPRKAAKDDNDIDIAQIHTVNRPLQEIGVWNDQGNGWSVLELAIGSIRQLAIGPRTVVVCDDDPYTEFARERHLIDRCDPAVHGDQKLGPTLVQLFDGLRGKPVTVSAAP